jgi:hypothetical protein
MGPNQILGDAHGFRRLFAPFSQGDRRQRGKKAQDQEVEPHAAKALSADNQPAQVKKDPHE